MSVLLTFRTDETKREQLDQIAKVLDRDRSYVLNEAINNYLDLHRWQLEHIKQGERDILEGRTYSSEEARQHLARLMTGQSNPGVKRKGRAE